MNSLEALFEQCKQVEKDLEVLKVLKKNIKLEDCKQCGEDHKCLLMLILDNEENYQVIKEWLEDESH